ncbi:hypothetical protein IV498_09010 [Paenarthrobacter sp. Z7-10]|uniref:FliH/SctL family protein n=1 Tax=Paenarthrobacter sp. Z7-10 TaxID=2787635 RepID=UPI0022A9F000|nr:FliH/SctL family protein [Paenarthrobacter sp. Z7-10]MCZ2403318.1 hypothetical protein [Paenarthrobacter sp. Z7-10]
MSTSTASSTAFSSTASSTGFSSTAFSTGSSTAFTPISFSPVEGTPPDGPGTPGYIRGHSIGYTFGMRAADAESKSRLAVMEAEHAAMLSQLQATMEQAVAGMHAAVTAVNAVLLPVVTEAQEVLLAASVELAEAVLGRELSEGDNGARAALTRALVHRGAAGAYTVRMHPADLAQLDEDTRAEADVKFIPDAGLQRGDAMAEFEHGYLDARIGTALARAKDALAEEPQRAPQ